MKISKSYATPSKMNTIKCFKTSALIRICKLINTRKSWPISYRPSLKLTLLKYSTHGSCQPHQSTNYVAICWISPDKSYYWKAYLTSSSNKYSVRLLWTQGRLEHKELQSTWYLTICIIQELLLKISLVCISSACTRFERLQ